MKRFAFVVALFTITALPAAAAFQPVSTQALISKLEWRNIGPFIGGRVVAVAGIPGRNLFYMGAVDGGIWKSTDYGVAWNNISDASLPSSSIGAIAVAPSNPNILYAGTGESDIRGTFITGDGIYKSTDAGGSWHYAGLRDTHTTSAIAIDPHNPNVVYASSMGHVFKDNPERGVFKSTDGGATWRKILYVNAATGAIGVVMDPKHPSTLYAAMWQAYRTPWKLSSGGPGSGIYKTIDGGAHWTNLTHHAGLPHGISGRIGVAVAASSPNIVYAIMQAKGGGVFRSDNAGATWRHVNSEWKLRQRAFYYMAIYVDPTNANTVYAPEVDALWVSRNGGKTWSRLRPPHGDNHIVWIDPQNPRILLEGNDGGATVSTDGGRSWSGEHNQPTGQFYHIDIDTQFPFHVYGAQQDEGSYEGPSATGRGSIPIDTWHEAAYGESTFVVPQPDNPSVTYGSGYYSIFLRYNEGAEEFGSISPWPRYREGGTSEEQRYRFGWTHPILFSPANPKELLVGSQYVLKSEDYGQTWQRISPDLTRNDPHTEGPTGGSIDLDQTGAETFPDIESLAVSPLDGNVIWAGSQDGLVHVTTDGGANWQSVTPPALPQWCEITSIEPSHTQKGVAYLTASRYMWDDFHPYVYQTNDYGAHWSAIDAGVPNDEYAYVIREDPASPNLLFLGTKNTVYVSLNGAAWWQPLTLNLPHAQVRDIAIDRRQGEVAIATHGRAFWILDNLALLEQLAGGSAPAANEAALFTPQSAWLSHAYGRGTTPAPRASAGTNPLFGATVFFHIPSSYNAKTPVALTFANEQGQVIRTFRLSARAIARGMNRLQWNLRYPDATEVTGFHPPIAAGGLEDTLNGPTVTPGLYSVTLHYGGVKTLREFSVLLDPRLHATPEDLAARFDLAMRIHTALDTLDKAINRAIAVQKATRYAPTRQRLTSEIAKLVQLEIKSSEGDVLHETKLRDHLAYLASELDLAYARPTAAQYAVFDELSAEAQAAEKTLASLLSS